MARKHRAVAVVVFLVGILLSGVGATVVLGQNPPGPPSVPGLLGDVLAMLAALQESVDQIQETLETPPAPEANTRFTAPVALQDGLLSCSVTNVSGTTRTVLTEFVDINGATVIQEPKTIPAGGITSRGIGSGIFTGYAYCRFTVQDGTKADIRGVLVLESNADEPLIAVPAE